MIFDKTQAMKLVKQPMTNVERSKTSQLTLAMGVALDDLSMRLRSKGFMRSYETTISANARTHNITGENNDLRSIFALKLGSDSFQRVLEYVEPQEFLRDYDSPEAATGRPNKYTQLISDGGYPTLRFNKPLVVAEVLKVYYYTDMTPDNISAGRSISAVVTGTQAYFWGIQSVKGAPYYDAFEKLAALARASDTYIPTAPTEMRISQELRTIMNTANTIRQARR